MQSFERLCLTRPDPDSNFQMFFRFKTFNNFLRSFLLRFNDQLLAHSFKLRCCSKNCWTFAWLSFSQSLVSNLQLNLKNHIVSSRRRLKSNLFKLKLLRNSFKKSTGLCRELRHHPDAGGSGFGDFLSRKVWQVAKPGGHPRNQRFTLRSGFSCIKLFTHPC